MPAIRGLCRSREGRCTIEPVSPSRRPRGVALAAVAAGVLALGAIAAAGLPDRGGASSTAAALVATGTDGGDHGTTDPYGLSAVDARDALFGGEGAAPAADDRAVPETRRPARTAARPKVMPLPTAPDAACRLDLGYGIWPIDTTAARSLTMITAVAYRNGIPVQKAGRAFQRSLHIVGRVPATPEYALKLLHRDYRTKRVKPYAVDAVLALYRPKTLTCVYPYRTMPYQPMLTNGLTMRSQAMVFGFFAAYGGRPLGGFHPDGITSGHIENSAHYDGRAVDVFFRPINAANNQRGWLLAHWLMAHADYHQIATVIWDDVIWSKHKADEGWRPYVHPSGNTESPVLRHLDHIHVDVVLGVGAPTPEPTPEPTPGPNSAARDTGERGD